MLQFRLSTLFLIFFVVAATMALPQCRRKLGQGAGGACGDPVEIVRIGRRGMAMLNDQSGKTNVKLRWFHPTPSCLLVVLLVVEGILFFSERWFPKV